MFEKSGRKAYNRQVFQFFRNMSKGISVTGSRTSKGYVFLAQYETVDLLLFVDRKTNTLNLVRIDNNLGHNHAIN